MRFWLGTLWLLIGTQASSADGGGALALFQERGGECHGKAGKVKGKLDLLKVDSIAALTNDLERLETIIDVV